MKRNLAKNKKRWFFGGAFFVKDHRGEVDLGFRVKIYTRRLASKGEFVHLDTVNAERANMERDRSKCVFPNFARFQDGSKIVCCKTRVIMIGRFAEMEKVHDQKRNVHF